MKKVPERMLKKSLVCIILVILCMGIVSGCGSDGSGQKEGPPGPEEPLTSQQNVALVLGIRSKSAVPNLEVFRDFTVKAADEGGHLSVISVEGTPRQVFGMNLPEKPRGVCPERWEWEIYELTGSIMGIIQSEAYARTPEADIMMAIYYAGRALRAQPSGNHHLVVYDSGLGTTGIVDFTSHNIEEIDVINFVDRLKENKMLPDLAGMNIYWFGMGDVADSQSNIHGVYLHRLQQLWKEIITAAGGNFHLMEAGARSEASRITCESLPHVSPINFSSLLLPKECTCRTIITFDEESVNFEPDTAQLLTCEEEVKGLLLPVTSYLMASPEHQILIIGTTSSWGEPEGLQVLSYQRANRIRELIIEAIIDKEFDATQLDHRQIFIEGLGFENPFTIWDRDEWGDLDEDLARQNRQVIIQSISLKRGQQVELCAYCEEN